MQQYLPTAHVSNADLAAGRLRGPLEAVLNEAVPPPPDLSGAGVAADRILATM